MCHTVCRRPGPSNSVHCVAAVIGDTESADPGHHGIDLAAAALRAHQPLAPKSFVPDEGGIAAQKPGVAVWVAVKRYHLDGSAATTDPRPPRRGALARLPLRSVLEYPTIDAAQHRPSARLAYSLEASAVPDGPLKRPSASKCPVAKCRGSFAFGICSDYARSLTVQPSQSAVPEVATAALLNSDALADRWGEGGAGGGREPTKQVEQGRWLISCRLGLSLPQLSSCRLRNSATASRHHSEITGSAGSSSFCRPKSAHYAMKITPAAAAPAKRLDHPSSDVICGLGAGSRSGGGCSLSGYAARSGMRRVGG
jgi:hypothetical protein